MEFGAVLPQEAGESRSIFRSERRDLALHRRNIRTTIQFPARTKLNSILRIEPNHLDLVAQRSSRGREDLFQHSRVKKESRTKIKLETVRLDPGSATTDQRK